MDADRQRQVEGVLDTLRPWLRNDGGDVELVEISAEGKVSLRLTGACNGCAGAHSTMGDGIRMSLQMELPWVTDVVAVN
ncbi:MAG: NifU family protein [Planctomycetes bacterium]|nr:NifU family protein [Planctomycetota bacterium]